MIRQDIEQLIKPTVEEMGYMLWGCEYLPQGRHSLLRIYIDQDAGIGVEDCERVSRQVSALLDVEDPIPGNYSLEVSSPGIPRPLFYDWQYQRFIGQNIQVKLLKPISGQRKFAGTIVSAESGSVVLKVGEEHQEFLISNIVKANLTGE